MLNARERYSGGRIVAALAMALAGAGAVNVYFQTEPPGPDDRIGLAYLAGAAAGLIAGWRHLGTRLGKGFVSSALMGLGAALIGLLYALLLIALRMTVGVYGFSKFDTVMELANFLLMHAVNQFWLFLQPAPMASLVLGGLIAGVFAEHYKRIWS